MGIYGLKMSYVPSYSSHFEGRVMAISAQPAQPHVCQAKVALKDGELRVELRGYPQSSMAIHDLDGGSCILGSTHMF